MRREMLSDYTPNRKLQTLLLLFVGGRLITLKYCTHRVVFPFLRFPEYARHHRNLSFRRQLKIHRILKYGGSFFFFSYKTRWFSRFINRRVKLRLNIKCFLRLTWSPIPVIIGKFQYAASLATGCNANAHAGPMKAITLSI